jgi:hypothetical protein
MGLLGPPPTRKLTAVLGRTDDSDIDLRFDLFNVFVEDLSGTEGGLSGALPTSIALVAVSEIYFCDPRVPARLTSGSRSMSISSNSSSGIPKSASAIRALSRLFVDPGGTPTVTPGGTIV